MTNELDEHRIVSSDLDGAVRCSCGFVGYLGGDYGAHLPDESEPKTANKARQEDVRFKIVDEWSSRGLGTLFTWSVLDEHDQHIGSFTNLENAQLFVDALAKKGTKP